MKIKLSKQDQQIVALWIVCGGIGFWMYASYLVGPLMRDLSAVRREVQSSHERLNLLESAVANETLLKNQRDSLEKAVASLRSRLPAEEQLPTILERLSDLASQANVKIQTIFPERQTEDRRVPTSSVKATGLAENAVYKGIPIRVEALAGYHQLGTFLNLIELEDKPMELEGLDISGGRKELKRHNIKLMLKAYVAVKGDSL